MRLPRWPRPALLITTIVILVAMIAAAFFLGYMLRGDDRAAIDNADREVVVTATAESRTPALDAVSGVLGVSQRIEVLAFVPAGARSAVVTRAPVAVGEVLHEGSVAIEISGRPVFALSLALRPYRDFGFDMRGADIRALNDSLVRIGLLTEASDHYDARTQGAVAQLYADAGYLAPGGKTGESLPLDELVLLPAGEVTVASVRPVDTAVSPGDAVLTAGQPVTSATFRADIVMAEQLSIDLPAAVRVPGSDVEQQATISAIGEFQEAGVSPSGESLPPGYDVTLALQEGLPRGAGEAVVIQIELPGVAAVAVPVTALRSDGAGTFVWRQITEGFERVDVRITSQSGGWALLEQESPIADGDVIRVNP